jgi:hypothetical protein
VSKSSSLQGRARGSAIVAGEIIAQEIRASRASVVARKRQQRHSAQTRRLFLESLETRALLTTYTYPFGASPDDTGEFMLGDVAVNVVLLESDASIAPHDNGTIQQKVTGSSPVTINYTPENWTQAGIAAVKAKVTESLQWWEDTLAAMFPSAPNNLLDFKINWQYADNPVRTGYEPIARTSNDLINDSTTTGPGQGWLYDFLDVVGFDSTGNYTGDMRAFNNYTRQQAGTDWAFTIFVVNDEADSAANDGRGEFSPYGSFLKAYSIPGGQFIVTPAGRPVTTYAHEIGHQFWGLDEYFGGSTYTTRRGYYNTQNYNAEDNPALSAYNELQAISAYQGTVTGGTFALTINLANGTSFTTAPIAYNATNTTISSAINSAANGKVAGWTSDILVLGGPLTTSAIALSFSGQAVDSQDHPAVVINGAGLTGGGGVGIVSEVKAGRGNQQLPSIMATDRDYPDPSTEPTMMSLTTSYNEHLLYSHTMAMIGWQDSDSDGIFDVLDVPFTLSGSGQYDPTTQIYSFRGMTKVNTLPNLNPEGTQNDITINQISIIEAQIDNGPWVKVAEFPARTYSTNVAVDFQVDPGAHTVRIRSADTRTTVKSNIFEGDTEVPTAETLPGLTGVVFVDQNENGQWDNGEFAKSDVALELRDQNDNPLALTNVLEPSDYSQGWILNNVKPGVTLSIFDPDGTTGDVAARTTGLAPAEAGKVFTATDALQASLPTWSDAQKLKATFVTPVSTVSILAYGTSSTAPSFARLDAYDASNKLIARYSSQGIASGQFETMTVNRSASDIKYVIAYGRLLTEVVLDSLQWGPRTTGTTNSQGAFSFEYLPDGVYTVHIAAPTGYHFTNPADGEAMVTVAGGVASQAVNFGIAANVAPTFKFHNYGPLPTDRFNVNKNQDNEVTALDALIIINFLNSRPDGANGEIPQDRNPDVIGYIDVVPDNISAPNDVLAIINHINSRPNGEAENGSANGNGAGYLLGFGTYQPEGENTVPVPKNAAEYFAQNPLHLKTVRGAEEPCHCGTCTGIRVDALVEVAEEAALAVQSGSQIPEWVPFVSESRSLARGPFTKVQSPFIENIKANLSARAGSALWRKQGPNAADSGDESMESSLDDIARDVLQADECESHHL